MFNFVHRTVFKKGFTLLVLSYLFLLDNVSLYSGSLQDSYLTPFKINSASDEEILDLAKENNLEVSSPQEAREKLLEQSLSALYSSDDSLEVTIESQNSLSYFTVSSSEQSQEKILEVKGDVFLSLKEKDGSLHKIQANHILWSEKRKTLYASNKVSYLLEKTGSDTFRLQGDGLYLDISEKSLVVKGVKGQTPWVQEGQSLTLSFSGNSLRGSLSNKEEILVIEKKGFLTTSHIFKPYYRIQAQKIWAIGSGEWAVWNAVFYLGNVPIFYLPYYFYSNRILSFNPQFGFDRYRGGFLGTTFYFIGQPTQEKNANSLYSYLRGSFNASEPFSKKKKEGLWWVSTNESTVNSDYLKLMVDLYSNLGLYFALDFSFKKIDSSYGGHFGIGLSRNLYLHSDGIYYPFPERLIDKNNIDWQDFFEINKTYLGGLIIPFRWAFSYSQEYKHNDLRLFLELDHYSDSYVYRDFLSQRSEASNFLKGLDVISGSSYLKKWPDQIGDASLSSRFNFSNSPLINRFFQNFRLIYQNSHLSHQYLNELSWEIKEAGLFWTLGRKDISQTNYDPMSSWFYLRKATFPSTTLNLRGTLLNWKKDFNANEKLIEKEDKVKESLVQGEIKKTSEENINILPPKPFSEPLAFKKSERSISVNLFYRYNPNLSLDSFWNGSLWQSPQEVQWTPSQVSFNWRDYASLEFVANFWEKFFILKASPKVTSNWLGYIYQTPSKFNQYRTNSVIIEQSFSLGSYFFQDIQWLRNSYILYNTSFNYLSYIQNIKPDNIINEYKNLFSKDSFKKNEVEIFNEISDSNKGMSSSLIYRFPNNTSEFEHNLKGWLSFHPFKIDTLLGYKIDSKETTKKIWGTNVYYLPISQVILRESIYYDVQKQQLDSLNTLIRLGFFEFSFFAKQDYPYYFDKQSKSWQIGKGPNISWDKNKSEFLPYSLRMSLKGNIWENTNQVQKGRFYINIDTGYNTSLQRFTQSEFQFQWKLGFYLNDFTEISIFSLSENKQFYRYFPFIMQKIGYPEETLPFWQDLWDSFSFWDSEALKKTNFKWNSFRLDIKQIFYDWYLTVSWSASPGLKTVGKRRILSWQNGFSFFVRWTPSTSVKSYLKKDKDSDVYQTGFGETF